MNLVEKLETLSKLERAVSGSNIIQVNHENLDLFAKTEFQLFGGSTKMRPAYRILLEALKSGEINESTQIIESSSGNFAIAMSMLCKILNLHFTAVVDKNTNPGTIQFLNNFASEVVIIDERDTTGGYLLNRLRYIDNFIKINPNSYWTNQYANINSFQSHYETTASEIINQLPTVEYVFIAAGTCGSLSGISTRLKEFNSNIKIIAVDVVGSVIFGEQSKSRFIPGMGASIIPPLLKKATIDEILMVDEIDAIKGCWNLFNDGYIFAGGSSGTIYSAINKYFEHKHHDKKPIVLFICPDGGRYYNDTVYNKDWVETIFKTKI